MLTNQTQQQLLTILFKFFVEILQSFSQIVFKQSILFYVFKSIYLF